MTDYIDLGDLSEVAILDALGHAFGRDFVFHSPERADTSKPEEATDVLVLFGDVALVVESKARAHKPGTAWFDPDTGWAEKNIQEALKQLNRAARLFREKKFGPVTNERRENVNPDTQVFKDVFGLIIVNHRSAPYDAETLVPALKTAKVPTLVLSLNDLLNLAKYVDTPADMVNYLETRYAATYPKLRPAVHEEQTAFVYYAKHFEQISRLRMEAMGRTVDEKAFEAEGTLWRQAIAGQLSDAKYGRIFDGMLDELHKRIDMSPALTLAGLNTTAAPKDYVVASTELGWYTRVRRIALGKRMFNCIQQAERTNSSRSFRTFSPSRSLGIVFEASTRSDAERHQRAADLAAMTALAQISSRARMAIGIATEARMRGLRSYDVVVSQLDFSGMTAEQLEKTDAVAAQTWAPLSKRLQDEIEE